MEPQSFEPPSSEPQPAAVVPPRHARSRRLTNTAIGATAALALVTGGYGIGATFGSQVSSQTPSATHAMLNRPSTGYGGITVPTDPFGNEGSAQGPQQGLQTAPASNETTRAATNSELTGLVRVDTTLGYEDGEAAGTGLILTSDGEVVTNHHVVAGATAVKVTVMSTGQSYTAKVVGTDATDDVAVLQLQDASNLTPVTTDTSGVTIGDAVTAVGDAGGSTSSFTAATGSVSGTDEHITTQAEGSSDGETLNGLIQVSADVISGDSGGATYDKDGEVVGMTTAASAGGTDVDGYAIPIAKVLSIATDLENGTVSSSYAYGKPAFLGIQLRDGSGTTVQGVYDGGAADKAGIVGGDTITKVGSTTVDSETALEKAIAAHSPGDHVTITWTDQSGSSHSATVTLGTGPVA